MQLSSMMRLPRKVLVAAGASFLALAATAASYYFNGSSFVSSPTTGTTYNAAVVSPTSGNGLFFDSANPPSSGTFFYDPATNKYKNTTTLALSSYTCGSPLMAGQNSVVICDITPTPSSGGSSTTTTPPFEGSSNIFGGSSAVGFVDQYGLAWDLVNPKVTTKSGVVLAAGTQVNVQTTAASPKVVAYTINIPDPNVEGQTITLTNVFFGCRPDLGNFAPCDGLMSFEFDTTADSWRLVGFANAADNKMYVDTFAATNNFATAADLVADAKYVVTGSTWTGKVTPVQNMGIVLANALARWDWSKY